MIVGTKYDKELKEKVFYVREVDSYTHKTTTTLTVNWVDGVFTLTAVVNNLIGKGFVKFYRDGVEVGEQYVSKTATLLLQSETKTGVFVAKFMGNSDCLKSQSNEVGYSPLPHPEFSLTVDKDTGIVGDVLTFTPHLPDDATGSIVYTVDGTEYMQNVSETFSYKFNKGGSFTVGAVYSGDDSYQGATAYVLVTISKTDTVLTGAVDKTSVAVGENVLCTLYLKDNQNNPLANKTVYCGDWSKTTNDDGKVLFDYANPTTGTVTRVFKFDGDNSYNGASATAKWAVNRKPVTLTVTANKTSVAVGETVTLTATVKSNGVNVNEGQVDFGDGVLVDVSNGTAVKTVTKTTPQSITFTPAYERTSTYNNATASPLTITWIEESVTPQITIYAPTLIGEVGDDLPITISSNLKNTDLTVLLNNVEVADTATTNDNGKASFNYNCTGAGDVNVKVKYLNGTNVYYSNILNLEDCLVYDAMISDSGKWSTKNNPTITYTTNGINIQGVNTGEAHYYLKNTFNSPFVFECTVVENNPVVQDIAVGFDYDMNGNWWVGHDVGGGWYCGSTTGKRVNGDLNNNDKVKVIVEENKLTVYCNDNLITSVTGSNMITRKVFFYTNKGRSQTAKDVKIKPV